MNPPVEQDADSVIPMLDFVELAAMSGSELRKRREQLRGLQARLDASRAADRYAWLVDKRPTLLEVRQRKQYQHVMLDACLRAVAAEIQLREIMSTDPSRWEYTDLLLAALQQVCERSGHPEFLKQARKMVHVICQP